MRLKGLKPFYFSIAFLVGIVIIGVTGFAFFEGWSFTNAFFMTIQTVSTVGYGPPEDLSAHGKLFASVLIIISVGFYAFAVTTLARNIVSGEFRNYFKYTKVTRDIEKLENHVIVIGFGRNGSQSVLELNNHKIPVVVIESREEKIKEIQQIPNLLYIHDDPSSDEVLLRAGIKSAKALISVLPTDEENLFVVLTSRELNRNIAIISRAINPNTIKKLKIAGASYVIMPDKISGQQMAKMIAQPHAIEFLDYLLLEHSKDFSLGELYLSKLDPDNLVTLGQLSERCKVFLNIIGIKRSNGNYLVNPGPETSLVSSDILFVLGRPVDIEAFKKVI
jgi:voltage-gated potassium channel